MILPVFHFNCPHMLLSGPVFDPWDHFGEVIWIEAELFSSFPAVYEGGLFDLAPEIFYAYA